VSCQCGIEVGPDLFESLSNKLSIKCLWTSIALRMDEYGLPNEALFGLPTNRKFNFDGLAL
jgi:hypothetical protein